MCKSILVDVKYGGVEMFIGSVINDRMTSLGMSKDELIEKSFVDEDVVKGLLNNSISISDVDVDDISFIAEVLYCTSEYFTNKQVRENDILNSSLNRGKSSLKSNKVKVKIQAIMEDFEFMNSIYEQVESGV
jgi:hypothetical protein